MADFVITVSQADIRAFAIGMFWVCFAGAALGAGLPGVLWTTVRELWHWKRAIRRLARMQRREVARG